jgi:5,10-methylenetetrahydrofolate reductase
LSKIEIDGDLPGVGVAYNPFLPADQLVVENIRLEQKLSFKSLNTVYLQIGVDENAFIAGLDTIRKLRKDITIIASVMVPTAFSLSRFEMRPWKGVVLPEEFSQSMEDAIHINKKYCTLLSKHNIEPLYSLNVITEQCIETIKNLTT